MKKTLSAGIVLIFCFLFISCKSKDSGQVYTLKMRLAIGDKVVQEMENEMKSSVGDFKNRYENE